MTSQDGEFTRTGVQDQHPAWRARSGLYHALRTEVLGNRLRRSL